MSGAGRRCFSEVARRLVAWVDLSAGARVLDVATSAGAALLAAAQPAGPVGMAVGVDLAESMVAEARRRRRAAGVADAAVLVIDAEALGFRAEGFDAVLASALSLLPQPVAALRGFWRVLRPGGRLAVFGADLDQRWRWRGELLARWAPALEPARPPRPPGPPGAGAGGKPASPRWRRRSSAGRRGRGRLVGVGLVAWRAGGAGAAARARAGGRPTGDLPRHRAVPGGRRRAALAAGGDRRAYKAVTALRVSVMRLWGTRWHHRTSGAPELARRRSRFRTRGSAGPPAPAGCRPRPAATPACRRCWPRASPPRWRRSPGWRRCRRWSGPRPSATAPHARAG